MRYSSKFLRSRCCPHTGKLLTKPFRVRRRARTRQTAPARTLMMKNRFAFGSTDMHANGLVSYASDAKQIHNKTSLTRGGSHQVPRIGAVP